MLKGKLTKKKEGSKQKNLEKEEKKKDKELENRNSRNTQKNNKLKPSKSNIEICKSLSSSIKHSKCIA